MEIEQELYPGEHQNSSGAPVIGAGALQIPFRVKRLVRLTTQMFGDPLNDRAYVKPNGRIRDGVVHPLIYTFCGFFIRYIFLDYR